MSKKKWIVAGVSVICAAAVLYGVYYALFQVQNYVPYEDAGIKVTEDGKMHIEEAYSEQMGYGFSDKHLKFFFLNDNLLTKDKKKKEAEVQTLTQMQGEMIEELTGESIQTDEYYEMYYPPEEYAVKLQDRDFMTSMNDEERDTFLQEMKEASVLLWKTPKESAE